MVKLVSVTFAESAIVDLEQIRDYYCEQGVPDVGERFLGEIISLLEELPTHPDRGRIVPEFDQPFLRELIHPPFRIVYRRRPQNIAVVRVWRSERMLNLPQ